MAMPGWLRWHWQWLVSGLLVALMVILYFVSTLLACCVLVAWIYVVGHKMMMNQAYPFSRPLGATIVVFMLLGTTLVTLIPWLFFGGRDECGSFDPTMKTQWGYDFEDWWTLLHFQMSVNWFMATALSCLILADHPPSCYVRESIRCVVFMFLGMLAKNTRTALYCCLGSDEDEDGVRDMVPDALMPATYAIAASLLSDIWCLQLVVARLRALQDAYGEPLGCTKLIRWGANLLVFWLFVLSACLFISTIATLVTSLCCVLGLAALGFLICRAYSVPLQVLRASKRGTKEGPSGPHGMSKQLEKEASFAISVIIQAQVATLLANFSMIWHLTSWALTYVLPTTFINHTFEYGGLADTVGNTIGILLLINSSLRLPHCGKHFRAKLADPSEQSAARDVEEDAACQCGRHLATKVLTAFDDAALCERCAWEQKVQELAGRRITTAQLLDFHARLGRRHNARALPTLMPHFDPEKSTTNDVVRQAIIPESRLDDQGSSLAEVFQLRATREKSLPKVWPLQTGGQNATAPKAPRMVTHHWANRFRDLVAVVLADGLGLRRWDQLAEELSKGQEEEIKARLHARGSLGLEYWICAFCINQHASICGSSMGVRDTVTGDVLPSCDCVTPKFFNDTPIQCELNKFDDMMGHLHRRYKESFLQVVAVDKDFQVFSRAWCVAELIEANSCHLDQRVVLHSPEALEQHSWQLGSLKVENCSASRAEDKQAILSKIGGATEIAQFNTGLQNLLLGSEGLLAGWLDGQQLLQEVGAIAARARARQRARATFLEDPGEAEEDFVSV